ncbi:MAG: retroviral-like aspartic protease family protein, partial [Tepidisphaeraceae bacterium]
MNRLCPVVVAAVYVIFVVWVAGAQEQVLASKGMVKAGLIYVLAGEQDLADNVRAIRMAKAKFDTETKERQQLEQKIGQAKSAAANLDFERKRMTDSGRPNQQAMARIEAQLQDIARFRADAESRLKTLGEQTRTDYINKVVAGADLAEKLTGQYEQLAADDAVKQAIDKINEAGRGKFRLGPSPDFVINANTVKKLRGDVNAAVIPLRMHGRVPTTDVILNGKVTREMVIDSGASTVVLPGELAEELGLNPTDKDPTLRMQLADGKVIEGKQMTLKSVKVGIFTVEDVECAVMPKNLIAVSPLLGGSFLHNFVYKLDPEQAELHLAQVPGKESKVRVGDAPKPPAARPPVNPPAVKPDIGTPVPVPPPATRDDPSKDPVASNTTPTVPALPDRPAPPEKPVAPDKPATPDTPVPTDKPDPGKAPPGISTQTKRVVDYLDREYKRKLESPDWRQRGLAVICLARLPQAEVTDKLISLIDGDKHDIVRLLAWEAVVARAPDLSTKDFQRFYAATLTLAEKGAFRGSLRAPMLDMLATMPMNPRARKVFERVLTEANAWEVQDIPALKGLGRCLGAWKSGQLAEELVRAFADQNVAYRSEYVLQAAGVASRRARDYVPASVFEGLSKDRSHMSSDEVWAAAERDYLQWLQKNRKEWSDARPAADAYKSLRPLYVQPPVTLEELDRDPSLWKPD